MCSHGNLEIEPEVEKILIFPGTSQKSSGKFWTSDFSDFLYRGGFRCAGHEYEIQLFFGLIGPRQETQILTIFDIKDPKVVLLLVQEKNELHIRIQYPEKPSYTKNHRNDRYEIFPKNFLGSPLTEN